MLCHDRPHGSSLEVTAAKISHQQGRLRSDQDTRLPGSPRRPRAPGQIPTVSRSQGSAHSSHPPPKACPRQLSPYCRPRHVPQLFSLSWGRAVTLPLLTPHVCQITAIKGRKVQLKTTAHLFIEEYGICSIPAETLPKSQVGLFLYISK